MRGAVRLGLSISAAIPDLMFVLICGLYRTEALQPVAHRITEIGEGPSPVQRGRVLQHAHDHVNIPKARVENHISAHASYGRG